MAKSKLVNPKRLCKVMGELVLIEGLMMLICLVVGLIYEEKDHTAFIVSLVVTFSIGIILKLVGINSGNSINRRESFLIVGMTWAVFSVLGTLPFLINGQCHTLGTALFESMSGFTCTGASVIPNIDALPHSLLFWRSFCNWIGGLGIVFFTMTILPLSGTGEIRLFAAESTGLGQEKLHTKIKTTATWIWTIYCVLTIGCALALYSCGMSVFDSINHAMAAVATGGFSTHNAGILYYQSSILQYVIIVFMFLGGVNFYVLYTMGTKRCLSPLRRNSEIKYFFWVIVAATLLCTMALLINNGYDLERAVRVSLFNCVSIGTTTGFTVDNYQQWYAPTCMILMFLMFSGACSGSTTGGFKSIRMLIIIKTTHIQFKRIIHPNAIIPVQINKSAINSDVEHNVMSLLFWFLFLIIIGAASLMLVGVPGYDSCAISLASICNIGTNFGHHYGPAQGLSTLPEAAKWICSFLMLAGRLEIFVILLPFTRSFWQRH